MVIFTKRCSELRFVPIRIRFKAFTIESGFPFRYLTNPKLPRVVYSLRYVSHGKIDASIAKVNSFS